MESPIVLAHVGVRRIMVVAARITPQNLDSVNALVVNKLNRGNDLIDLVKTWGVIWMRACCRAL